MTLSTYLLSRGDLRNPELDLSNHLATSEPAPRVGESKSYTSLNWLVVSTQLKNISQNGNLPQVGVKIKKYLKPPPSKGPHSVDGINFFNPPKKIDPQNGS